MLAEPSAEHIVGVRVVWIGIRPEVGVQKVTQQL